VRAKSGEPAGYSRVKKTAYPKSASMQLPRNEIEPARSRTAARPIGIGK
jgi:hypothetical protein